MISPYIEHLRTMIGHRLLLVPSVAVLPRDSAGRLLLVRHADSGKWATLGGSIEPDEPPEDAARREAEEEAGITVELGRLLGVLGGPEYRIVYPNGDEVAYVSVVYEAGVRSGVPRPDGDETTEVGWFSVEQLGDLEIETFNRCLLEAVLQDEPSGQG